MHKDEIIQARKIAISQSWREFSRQTEKLDPPSAFFIDPFSQFPDDENLFDGIDYDDCGEWKKDQIEFYMAEGMTADEAEDFLNSLL